MTHLLSRLFVRVGRFALYGNAFVALCAASATYQTFLWAKSFSWSYLFFIFSATFAFYNIQRLALYHPQSRRIHSPRHQWLVKNRDFLAAVTGCACVISLGIASQWSHSQQLLFCGIGVGASLYFLPPVSIREIPIVKGIHVALFWTLATSSFPLILVQSTLVGFNSGSELSYFVLQGVERFLFILPLCIVFNVRDVDADRKHAVRTVPILFGVERSILWCRMILAVFSLMVACRLLFPPSSIGHYRVGEEVALIASAIISGLVVSRISESTREYYYLFVVDGLIPLQTILWMVFSRR